jgi:hypothetical protein
MNAGPIVWRSVAFGSTCAERFWVTVVPLRVIEQTAQPVPARDLPRQANRIGSLRVVRGGPATVGEEGICDVAVVGPVPARGVEPQPVLDDRTAQAVVDVVVALKFRRGRNSARAQLIVEVLSLHVSVGKQQLHLARKYIPARSRDPVDEHTRELVFSRSTAHLHRDFLRLILAVGETLTLAGLCHPIDHNSIDQDPRVAAERSMDRRTPAT